jgi:xanthine dehydrogenase accessory factor
VIRRADIRAAVARDERAVLVLVAEAHGSSPREAGAAMLVAPSGATGTVGGGTVEHRAVEIARLMLAGEADPRAEIEFPLGPALDQCCGGRMRLAFALLTRGDQRLEPDDGDDAGADHSHPLQGGGSGSGSAAARPGAALELWPGGPVFREPEQPRLVVVYGAGHVGTALVRALAPLPFRTAWVDARAGACAGAPEGVEVHETPLPEALAEAAGPDALHVVATHSHALDLEIVTAVMQRPFGYCGLIGSATKRATFRRRLAERGVAREAIDRLTCPIGLPGLRDKRPAVIAASVAAQLLQMDRALAGCRLSERAG